MWGIIDSNPDCQEDEEESDEDDESKWNWYIS